MSEYSQRKKIEASLKTCLTQTVWAQNNIVDAIARASKTENSVDYITTLAKAVDIVTAVQDEIEKVLHDNEATLEQMRVEDE